MARSVAPLLLLAGGAFLFMRKGDAVGSGSKPNGSKAVPSGSWGARLTKVDSNIWLLDHPDGPPSPFFSGEQDLAAEDLVYAQPDDAFPLVIMFAISADHPESGQALRRIKDAADATPNVAYVGAFPKQLIDGNDDPIFAQVYGNNTRWEKPSFPYWREASPNASAFGAALGAVLMEGSGVA